MSTGKANKYFNDVWHHDKKNLSTNGGKDRENSMQNMHKMNFPETIKIPRNKQNPCME
jgi:hypothetical protein